MSDFSTKWCILDPMIEQILKENGFTDKEAKVYVAVLEYGEATVAQVAQKARLKRTTVYDILEPLRERGIVSIVKRKGTHRIAPLPPQNLIDRFKRSATLAESALPQLIELAYSSPLKPRTRFYEGMDGLKEVLREMSYSKQETVGFTDYAAMPREMLTFIQKVVIPNRKERGNKMRLIAPYNKENEERKKNDPLIFSEHRLVAFPQHVRHIEILLFDHTKTGFLSFEKDELFGLILDSAAIHTTLRNVFELVWAAAKP